MKLKKIYIKKFRQFENFEINFEESEDNIYALISKNGLGKSNLLQFIFVMINVLKSEEFHLLLKNLLENEIEDFPNEKTLFSEFEFIGNNIKYYIVPIEWNEINFKDYEEIIGLEAYLDKLRKIEITINNLNSIVEEIKDMPEILLRENLRDIYHKLDDRLFYDRAFYFLRNKDKESLKTFIEKYIEEKQLEIKKYNMIDDHLNEIKIKINTYENILEQKNLKKICKINDNYFLLAEIENKDIIVDVYLVAPNYQPFHFLEDEKKQLLLENFEGYVSILESLREKLNNKIYFYNFLNEDEVIETEELLMRLDKEHLDKTGEYGKFLPTFKKELSKLLENKTLLTDEYIEILYENKKLSLTDLSHGELKKLSLYLWSKYYPTKNSIVLFDELELSFHPSWQIEIIENLKEWLKDKQIIIATHSPQILNNINYKNIILLNKENKTLEAISFNKPPINRDVNSILKEIMGSEFIPKKVLKLREEFERAYFNGENEKAEKIKEELLKWEGNEYIRRIEYLYMLGKNK